MISVVDRFFGKIKTGLNRASFLFVLPLFFVGLSGCDRGPEVIKLSGWIMGTSYHITVVADQPGTTDLEEQVVSILTAVDLSMSTYKEVSELSRFNRLAVSQPMEISEGLHQVLSISQHVWEQTEGAFDPTVGPLVDLWGFGPAPTLDHIPAQGEIDQAVALVGFEHLLLEAEIAQKTKRVAIDLSAVAKGFAVDNIADFLEEQAQTRYMVEVGGEMRVSGTNPNNQPWRVAIESPAVPGQEMISQVNRIIPLQDMAIATSGDYRNYFEKDGKRYSHTIDPRTGRPITHNLASVTVLTERCAEADALATAFMVMGAEQTLTFADQRDLPVYMLVKQDNGFDAIYSQAFSEFLED